MSIGWVGHGINVIGSPREPNTITVGLNPGGASIYATVSYPTPKGGFTQTKDFPLSQGIGLINIGGGNNSDLITIDQTNGSFPITTHINTHGGNDTVMGGDENDRIICGKGVDSINGGNGNDVILAGRARDTLIGGAGNDVFHTGPGHDLIEAGNGNNTFIDPYGGVTITAGSGHNTYILKSIQLDPDTDYTPGKDTLKKYVPPQATDSILNDVLNGLLDYGSFL